MKKSHTKPNNLTQNNSLKKDDHLLAKNKLLLKMIHDLKNSMSAIVGYTDILLMKLPGPLTSEQEKQLIIIRESTKDLLNTADKISFLKKIELGMIEVQLKPCELSFIFSKIKETFENRDMKNKLSLMIEEFTLNLTLKTDDNLLIEILFDLISNIAPFIKNNTLLLKVESSEEKNNPVAYIKILSINNHIPEESFASINLSVCYHLAEKINVNIELLKDEETNNHGFCILVPLASA